MTSQACRRAACTAGMTALAATATTVVTVLCGGTAASAVPAPASAVSLTKSLAYVRSGVIYLSKGATETALTVDAGNSRPRFSPDGRRIAYLHNGTVWVMNADGSAKRQLSSRIAGGPSWSPDGTLIAFATRSCTGGPGVYRIPSTGTAPLPVVLFPASCRDQVVPQAVVGPSVGDPPTGSGLADRLRRDDAVAWSPDGTRIAFRGGECDSIADACLSVGDVATGGETAIDVYGGGGNLATGFGVVPAWRVDGKKVTWTAHTDGCSPVHLQEADADGAHRRTIGTADDREMVYLGIGKGVLTSTYHGRSWVTVLDLGTGERAQFRNGSQPTVQP
jgi:TolB protein